MSLSQYKLWEYCQKAKFQLMGQPCFCLGAALSA